MNAETSIPKNEEELREKLIEIIQNMEEIDQSLLFFEMSKLFIDIQNNVNCIDFPIEEDEPQPEIILSDTPTEIQPMQILYFAGYKVYTYYKNIQKVYKKFDTTPFDYFEYEIMDNQLFEALLDNLDESKNEILRLLDSDFLSEEEFKKLVESPISIGPIESEAIKLVHEEQLQNEIIEAQLVEDPEIKLPEKWDNDSDLLPSVSLVPLVPVTVQETGLTKVQEKQTISKLILTEHQQEKFDGVTKKLEEIYNLSNKIQRPPNAAYYMAVLEGAAGTGKTTMMVKVLEYLKENGYKMVFCSPTHQALDVIRNTLIDNNIDFTEMNEEFMFDQSDLIIKTLSSFLGIKMNRDLENGTESFVQDPRAPIIDADFLCVDESSMVSRDQILIILKKLHINVKGVLFIGDEVQLDSPSDKNEPNGVFTLPFKYSLEEVVRQAKDNKILQLAWELRGYILNKACVYKPSVLLHDGRNNENILILNDAQEFFNHYITNDSENVLMTSFTNKIVNEYNNYIRQMKLTGQGGKPMDIIIDESEETPRNIITSWDEYRQFYIGEKLTLLETNQRNNEVIHQNGEKIKIRSVQEDKHTLMVSVPQERLENFNESFKEYSIRYYRIIDSNGKSLNVIHDQDIELYQEIIGALKQEASKMPKGTKHAWGKFYKFKEKFTKVNRIFAYTLHKLQGSTCEDIYFDARDLDKFYGLTQIGIYKLIYIAITRAKRRIIILK